MTDAKIINQPITLQDIIDFKEFHHLPPETKVILDNEGFTQSQCHSIFYIESERAIHLFSEG